MSYPRHRVGDIVRLAKGWTPMTVIGLTLTMRSLPNTEPIQIEKICVTQIVLCQPTPAPTMASSSGMANL